MGRLSVTEETILHETHSAQFETFVRNVSIAETNERSLHHIISKNSQQKN